jgi:hypothetical protein
MSSPGTGLSSDIAGVNGSIYLWSNGSSRVKVLSAGPVSVIGGFSPAQSISSKTANPKDCKGITVVSHWINSAGTIVQNEVVKRQKETSITRKDLAVVDIDKL